MNPTHVIFVPAPGIDHGLAPRSAIVAALDAAKADMITVYYEGNLYDAENMRRFEERVYHAADRQAMRYPTVARRGFKTEELIQVGTFDHATRRVSNLQNLQHLRAWLGDEAGWVDEHLPTEQPPACPSADLATQLNTLIDAGLTFSAAVDAFASRRDDRENQYVEAAKNHRLTREGELEVDGNAIVSEGEDNGAYVLAWLWVDAEDAGLADEGVEEDDEEEAEAGEDQA